MNCRQSFRDKLGKNSRANSCRQNVWSQSR